MLTRPIALLMLFLLVGSMLFPYLRSTRARAVANRKVMAH
jgi:hypothetical protein